MIRVCSLARLNETIEMCRATNVVTLVRDQARVFRPKGIAEERHLWLQMDDIAEPAEGMIAPSQEHIEKLVKFVDRWERADPLVIHCFAGISRSTAAAFITACTVAPEQDETEIAQRLRAASPTASPNARLVSLADSYLGRDGRMIRAVDRIGFGQPAYEAEPFELKWD